MMKPAEINHENPAEKPTVGSFILESLGCKVSQYDGEKIAQALISIGFKRISAEEDRPPDLFILNGCSVTGRASQKVRQNLRAAKRGWPDVKVVLAGCEARLKDSDVFKSGLADALWPTVEDEKQLKALCRELGFEAEIRSDGPQTPLRTRGFLKIQDGCTQFCSYCIVPHLRGPETSRSIEELVKEACEMTAMGRKELVLTGIHIGRYGYHRSQGANQLVALLHQLEKIDGLHRLRISSIEPPEVTDELVHWLASSPKACRHLHLPLQSGCDNVLERMNRPYSAAQFARKVADIRKAVPEIGISTDLIVGFPGETDQQFAASLQFIETIGFSRIHIFRYSRRSGTPAAEFPNQISNATKHQRAVQAEQTRIQSTLAFHRHFLGRQVEILWEEKADTLWKGLTREYIPCTTPDTGISLANQITSAIITSTAETCSARVL